METLQQLIRYGHVAFGIVGITAFWIPIVTRKGGHAHRLFGRVFRNCAWVVLASAGLAVVLITARMLADGKMPATDPVTYGMVVFLGYLAFVTFVMVRHGVQVLKFKNRPQDQSTALNLWLARGAILASVVVIAWALIFAPPNRILLFALSPIGLGVGRGILSYLGKPPATPRVWMYEHLGAMIGGGIAFHTAFAVFGINRLFELGLTGWVAIIPWLAPAALGIPATIIWTRHYQKKYGELS